MRASMTTKTKITEIRLEQQMSEVIMLREKVAQAELAVRRDLRAEKSIKRTVQHPGSPRRAGDMTKRPSV